MGWILETWHGLWRVEPLPVRNGSARDACLPHFTEQGLVRNKPQACFNTHRARSQVSSLPIGRLQTPPGWPGSETALWLGSWAGFFCWPAQPLVCHWCFITSADTVAFMTAVEPKALAGVWVTLCCLRHIATPAVQAGRWKGKQGHRDLPAAAHLPWAKVGLQLRALEYHSLWPFVCLYLPEIKIFSKASAKRLS